MPVFQDDTSDSIEFLRFLRKHGRTILFSLGIVWGLTILVTFFLPKKYYSYGVIFPTYNNNVESVIDNPAFGYDVEADRLLQLLQSEEIRDSVVEKFNLLNYYHLDKSEPDWNDQLKERFSNDITFTRTPYMSILVAAETTKPELSAAIANYIIEIVDGTRDRIFKKNQQLAFHSIEAEYNAKKYTVDTLKEKISRLRESSQSDLVALINPDGRVQTAGSSTRSGMNTELERALNQYIIEQARLNDIGGRYEKAKIQANRSTTSIYVVDKARPSYKKVSPSFVVNLGITGIATLIFSISILLVNEKLRMLRQLDKQA